MQRPGDKKMPDIVENPLENPQVASMAEPSELGRSEHCLKSKQFC